MRQNVNTILLIAGVLLLGANLVGVLNRPAVLPVALGQAEDSGIVMAASNTQNEAFCFIYDTKAKKLVSYANRARGGLELMGIRNCANDFPQLIGEFPSSDKITAAKNMKKLADKIAKQQKKKKRP